MKTSGLLRIDHKTLCEQMRKLRMSDGPSSASR